MADNQITYRRGESGTERLLALSDGVFAIAITLLVLNLVPPTVNQGLGRALLDMWPSYLSYLMSFLLIGVIWTNHHSMFIHIKRTNQTFLLINIVFLLWVAVLPFPTSLLAKYLTVPSEQHLVMAIYAAMFVVGAVLFNVLWWYATYNRRLTSDGPDTVAIRRTTVSYYVGPVSYLVALGLAYVNVALSLILFVALAVFYAISPMMGNTGDAQPVTHMEGSPTTE
ncbi:MAG: hypothetical protein JWO42_3676 [Chloroflexi bacterium]|jgi:uncharacterized membrane protein|nr:hypothetical protein [Chloroflexota bacterium]